MYGTRNSRPTIRHYCDPIVESQDQTPDQIYDLQEIKKWTFIARGTENRDVL